MRRAACVVRVVLWAVILLAGFTATAAAEPWSPRSLPAPTGISEIAFLDADHGWIQGSPYSYRTTDGGSTWTTQTSDVSKTWSSRSTHPGTFDVTPLRVDFSDLMNGWGVGFWSEAGTADESLWLFRTSDGGAHWTRYSLISAIGDWSGLAFGFTDALHGWCSSENDASYVTSDGGRTWTVARTWPFAAHVEDDLAGWGSSVWSWAEAFYPLARTTNGGATWREMRVPVPVGKSLNLQPPRSFDSSRAIVTGALRSFGREGYIATTRDGGLTWARTNEWGFYRSDGGADVRGAWVSRLNNIGERDAWAFVTEAGEGMDEEYWIHSTDAGNHWTSERFASVTPYNTGIRHVEFSDPMNGWAANADGSVLLKTTTGGSSVPSVAVVGTPRAPSRMSRSRYYTVYGSVTPSSSPVRIYKCRWTDNRYWKSYGYVSTSIRTTSATSARYSHRIRLPYTGRWRLRAYMPATSRNYAEWSGSDYVDVY